MSITDDEVRARVAKVKVWYHKIELRRGISTPGINDPTDTMKHLELPADCRGMRALDLGARDGFFSFEMERRGAQVVAIDYAPKHVTGFATAAEILGSKVEYRQANIYDLTPDAVGKFDVVLFLGLLYHLPDPMQAINLVRALCTGRLCMETHAIDNCLMMPDGKMSTLKDVAPVLANIPLMQFYPGTSLSGDHTNYWGPNLKCLTGMLEECRFKVRSSAITATRAIVNCDVVEDDEKEKMLKLARGLRTEA